MSCRYKHVWNVYQTVKILPCRVGESSLCLEQAVHSAADLQRSVPCVCQFCVYHVGLAQLTLPRAAELNSLEIQLLISEVLPLHQPELGLEGEVFVSAGTIPRH